MKMSSLSHSWAPNQDIFMKPGKASESHRPYQFCLFKTQLSHAEFYKKYNRETTNYTITRRLSDNGALAVAPDKRHNPKKELDHRLIDECINWLQAFYPKEGNAECGQGKSFSAYLGRSTNCGLLHSSHQALSLGFQM